MRLSDLNSGESATIVKVLGHGAFRKRILEMGFVQGKEVIALKAAPLRDPVVYKIMDYEVSLRRSEASLIEVITDSEVKIEQEYNGTAAASDVSGEEAARRVIDSSKKRINIALVGNPNCGKTSLFNQASGSHEHVGNYSGVTVDTKRGEFRFGEYTFIIYDLPGTYSLSAYTPEELYVRRHIIKQAPDVVVNVVAATNIERNLYLTSELIDMDYRMVVAMNMSDELENSGGSLDYQALATLLGVPIVPTNSRNGDGFENLFKTIIEVYEDRNSVARHIHINYGAVLEKSISLLRTELRKDANIMAKMSTRYLAIKLLEGDAAFGKYLRSVADSSPLSTLRDEQVRHIEEHYNEDIETVIANQKYGFINGAVGEVYAPGASEQAVTARVIDSLVTHKVWGFPIFLAILWAMFTATFSLGAYPMALIESAVGWLSSMVQGVMTDGVLKDLIVDGVIGGVGGVIVFLPNIVILYLFISFMEDSGYMARAAFIMDKLMHKMGLHGKSFIPFIMGFGCNVPAIMATRTIESRSSRLITILVNPFFSCSARLPVYLLFVGAFFPKHSGTMLFMIYGLGILVAVITSKLLRKVLFKGEDTPFVMELPPYRVPTLKAVLTQMWDKSWQYLQKMGGVILIASIAIWFLSYFPRNESMSTAEQQRHSYLGVVGEACAPVMEPLGFDWRANVSLLTGMAAKEVIVSTLGVLYSADDTEGASPEVDEDKSLQQKLTSVNPETGKPFFTAVTALSFLAFVLLCFPCFASLAAIKGETGSWLWVLFSVIYNTSLAWFLAWLIKIIGNLF